MQKDYPYKFNDTPIFFPISWNEKRNVIENVNQSEAGTDIVTVVRYGKLSISVSCKATSDWVKKFQEFSEMDSFVLSRYDAVENDYTMHDVRMRNYEAGRVKRSEDIEITNGIWEISFNLEEI